MNGIKSWSSFEQQQRRNTDSGSNNNSGGGASGNAAAITGGRGIGALHVSSSSPNIAPAAATLLRHSGLTAPKISNNLDQHDGDGDDGDGRNLRRKEDEEEEFRLRFHWMRPHPSLAFALENELAAAWAETEDDSDDGAIEAGATDDQQQPQSSGNADKRNIHPAVEASKFAEAYRSSQIHKQIDSTSTDNDDNSSNEQDADNANSSKEHETEPNIIESNQMNSNLPLELPKLRINLASLVEPPSMSAWLPEEDASLSCDDDDGMDE